MEKGRGCSKAHQLLGGARLVLDGGVLSLLKFSQFFLSARRPYPDVRYRLVLPRNLAGQHAVVGAQLLDAGRQGLDAACQGRFDGAPIRLGSVQPCCQLRVLAYLKRTAVNLKNVARHFFLAL